MNDQKTYVKHVKTGEVFELMDKYDWKNNHTLVSVYDDHGEVRVFKREMLTPYDPDEAWEDVISFPVPGVPTRIIERDGKAVVQRRKG